MIINEDEILAAGFNEAELKRITSIARRISKAAKEAHKMGIEVFGGTSHGTLRFNDDKGPSPSSGLILADLDGCFDGGCGATCEDEHGLLRGE